MERPEDIPQWVWVNAVSLSKNKVLMNWSVFDQSKEISRAILSAVEEEREACAALAEDHFDDDGTGPDCQGCGEFIAERIRNRKGA